MIQTEFFIGFEQDSGEKPFLMNPQQLLTHMAVLGASGSGKTVICKTIIEDAIRLGIPVIAIDPKGDIGALGITFGSTFASEDIIPYLTAEAHDKRKDTSVLAQETISLYQQKLSASYGAATFMAEEADYSQKIATIIITPKSSAGIQISLTPEFVKPANYVELMTTEPDAILSALDLKIQLLLSRCGISGTSSTDNRIVFLNNLIKNYWEQAKEVISLEQLVESIQNPPFEKIGSLQLDKFISKNKREELARALTALLVRTVPAVELNFDKLIQLATEKGKTPLIVFDLRKILDEDERTTFVAEILGEIQRWAWSKGGTSQLRSIVYFDELYGFMPAGSRSPPSKTALLMLIKQARSVGVGCILATQNPADLDYRGLANVSTWILGKLITSQDINKVELALKSVFEANQGSQDEFKVLMAKVPALQPGQFLFYNAQRGVIPICSRWLLSLHKGPLTDEEIKLLSLRPPIDITPRSDVKSNSAGIITTESKIESLLVDTASSRFVKDKPTAIGIERFLKPKIDWHNKKELQELLAERLYLHSVLNDITLTIKSLQPFYAPFYYFKANIAFKRKIPPMMLIINVDQDVIRLFNLDQPINWEHTSIEGIHPMSISPQELSLEFDTQSQFQFLPFDVTKISKITENINWYFLNSPFTEADKTFYAQLRNYEREELEKLSKGTGITNITKLSQIIANLEDSIQESQKRSDNLQQRLQLLLKEQNLLTKQKKSTLATERSITALKKQHLVIAQRVEEAQKKLEKAESQRETAFQTRKSVYYDLKKSLKKLKMEGPPRDFYKLSKNDLTLSEQMILWIPRLLVTFEIQTPANTNQYQVNINLVNGNGMIPCKSCGLDISTQNYYQKLLENEVSPPTMFCLDCGQLFCSDHAEICPSCGRTYCSDHIAAKICEVCKVVQCKFCLKECANCHKFVCPQHSWTCAICEQSYCIFEEVSEQKKTKKAICSSCK